MEPFERTGMHFNLKTYLAARDLCQTVVGLISEKVREGMTEDDGQDLIANEFKSAGIGKFWHPSKFRIGADTVKSFRELPDKSIELKNGDIFFIDVGPVFDDHEADYGETFVFGTTHPDSQALRSVADASKKIWNEVADIWRTQALSGQRLYSEAEALTRSLGFKLNPLMAGHRLGDFPHALHCKERLATMDFSPSPYLWVLEIHIINESLQRGAFYEDILIS